MNKRGEKELQMIFGLFILLIITLVVLNLFLQASKKGIGQVEKSSTAELKSQEISRLKLNCQALCDQISDVNTAIEFCANFQTLDTDTDKNKVPEKARYGKYQFCKTKVPCFVVVDNCHDGIYTIETCKALLLSDRATWGLYNKLAADVGPIVGVTAGDGCKLPNEADPSASPDDFESNWKITSESTYDCDAQTACDGSGACGTDPSVCPP